MTNTMIRRDLRGKKASITLKNTDETFEARVREVDDIGIWIETAEYPGAQNDNPGGQILIKYEDITSISIALPLPGVPDLP